MERIARAVVTGLFTVSHRGSDGGNPVISKLRKYKYYLALLIYYSR